MRDIQTYLFDFGGVLIDLDRERCMEQFRLLGCPAVGQLLRDFRQQDFLYQHEKGLLSDEEFRDHVRRLCDRPLTDGEIDTAWNSFLGDIPQYKLDYLLELRRQGHPVAGPLPPEDQGKGRPGNGQGQDLVEHGLPPSGFFSSAAGSSPC